MLRRLRTAAVVLLPVLAVLTVPGDTSPVPAVTPAAVRDTPVPAGALERARQVAQSWPGSESERIWRDGYYPQQDGQYWLPRDFHQDDRAFAAFLGDRIDLDAEFPPFSGPGTVSFPDGTSRTLPLTDPRAAYEQLVRYRDTPCTREPCDTVLTVIAVRPATRPQITSRGTATVPVWEFRFAGVDDPYAVAAVESQEPPGPHKVEDGDLPEGVTDLWWANRTAGESDFWALLSPENCAAPLPGATYGTAGVLVLIGRTDGRPADCEPNGDAREARFRPAEPLGDRVVLNLAGRPVYFPAG
ncbi:hypothetical protein ACFVVL_11350 [Kitasatospora sp. NPDC058115]|uniref:hypothetical protein n=1 Tax=Kitasatospora sp. NPDC058115 TaxID=3346347 RepID=UPI0036DDF3B7